MALPLVQDTCARVTYASWQCSAPHGVYSDVVSTLDTRLPSNKVQRQWLLNELQAKQHASHKTIQSYEFNALLTDKLQQSSIIRH